MKSESFVDSIKPKELKGALRRIRSRISGLRNNSLQSLAVIPSSKSVCDEIDSMSSARLEQAKTEVGAGIREASK
jgi:hypothetical protein